MLVDTIPALLYCKSNNNGDYIMETYKVDEHGDIRWRNEDGKRHRLDGPAVESSDGSNFWYQNDRLHRLDGPAIEYGDGHKYWYQNGKLHRLDGPAIEYADGDKEWYIEGVKYCHEIG